MRSLLGFGGGILYYSQIRLLSSKRLRLPNPFLQFFNGPVRRGSKTYITQGKVRGKGESQRTKCKKQGIKSMCMRKKCNTSKYTLVIFKHN